MITTGIGGIWLIARRATRKERTETSSSSEMRVEMTMNNRGIEEEQDYRFTPKKVLAYCIIIGLISGTLSIFINSLIILSIGAFVFASITGWYMFGEKFHRWEERRVDKKKRRRETSI